MEILLLQLVCVELNQSPIVHEAASADLNLGTVQNKSKDAGAGEGVVIGNFGVEIVCSPNIVLGYGDEASEFVAFYRDTGSFAISSPWDLTEGRLPTGGRLCLVTNELHNGGNSVVK